MNLQQAIEWAHRAEPAEVFIASHPRKTQDALWLLVAEVERLQTEYRDIVQLAVDAEVITRSRCKELIGMSHHEIGKLFTNSPIGREVAIRCADLAESYRGRDPVHHIARAISQAISREFNLAD